MDNSSLFNSVTRPAAINQWCKVDAKVPMNYEALVTSYGPLEALQRCAVVYVPQLKTHFKAIIADEINSNVNGVGSHHPLNLGERVRINFLSGSSNIVQVTGRSPSISNLAKPVSEGQTPQPSPNTAPTPLSIVPEAMSYGGWADITVYGSKSPEPSPYSVVPSSTLTHTPDGKWVLKATNSYSLIAPNSHVTTTAKPKDGTTQPLEEHINKIKLLKVLKEEYDKQLDLDSVIKVIQAETTPNTIVGAYKLSQKTQELYQSLVEQATQDLSAAEKATQDNKKKNECISKDLQQQSLSSVIKTVLKGLAQAALNKALSEINDVLPSWAQVGYQNGKVSVAGLEFDSKNNSFSYQSSNYSALVSAGVSVINSKLPPHNQLSVSLSSVTLGNKTVSMQTLLAQPNLSFSLYPGYSVSADEKGMIKLSTPQGTYEAAKIEASDVVGSVAPTLYTEGVKSLNRLLPSELQLGGSLNYNTTSNTYSGGLTLGPVLLDIDGDDVKPGVDPVKLQGLVDQQLSNVISQLPPSVQVLARSLWAAVDFQNIAKSLFNKRKGKDAKSISKSKDACDGNDRDSLPPLVLTKTSPNTTNAPP